MLALEHESQYEDIGKKKAKKQYVSLYRNYSTEFVSQINKIAEFYELPLQTTIKEVIINGKLKRNIDINNTSDKELTKIIRNIKGNVTDARNIVDNFIIPARTYFPDDFGKKINSVSCDVAIKNVVAKLDMAVITLERLENKYLPERNKEALELFKDLKLIDRAAKVNSRKEKGSQPHKRLKIDADVELVKKVKAKAEYFFRNNGYSNLEDNDYKKPNDTAAIAQMFYSVEQLVTGRKMSEQGQLDLHKAGEAYNEVIKNLNGKVVQGVSFDPEELFDELVTLGKEIQRILKSER